MKTLLISLSLLFLSACGGKEADDATTPESEATENPEELLPSAAPEGTSMSSEECEAAGGTVVPSPGGPIECSAGMTQIGTVPLGIEGAICCR